MDRSKFLWSHFFDVICNWIYHNAKPNSRLLYCYFHCHASGILFTHTYTYQLKWNLYQYKRFPLASKNSKISFDKLFYATTDKWNTPVIRWHNSFSEFYKVDSREKWDKRMLNAHSATHKYINSVRFDNLWFCVSALKFEIGIWQVNFHIDKLLLT